MLSGDVPGRDGRFEKLNYKLEVKSVVSLVFTISAIYTFRNE